LLSFKELLKEKVNFEYDKKSNSDLIHILIKYISKKYNGSYEEEIKVDKYVKNYKGILFLYKFDDEDFSEPNVISTIKYTDKTSSSPTITISNINDNFNKSLQFNLPEQLEDFKKHLTKLKKNKLL